MQPSAPSPHEQILGIVNNYWQACSVAAAAQLEIADHLAGAPLHVDVLAQRTKTRAPSLYRLLRALEHRDIHASPAAYDWIQFPVIADIGGGIGAQLSGILDAHPSTEFRELYDRGGFELERIMPTASPLIIIVGRARS
jgi:hypothetical protein